MGARAACALVLALLPATQGLPAPRVWLGPALALDPAFAAATIGADLFFTPSAAVGVSAAHTFAGAGDRTAVESGYGFLSLLGRLRPALDDDYSVELFAGAGLGLVRFGTPGAHRELAPDVTLGAALGLPLPHRLELALELGTHVTFSAAAAARNPAHTSELLTVALRWGGPRQSKRNR